MVKRHDGDPIESHEPGGDPLPGLSENKVPRLSGIVIQDLVSGILGNRGCLGSRMED